MIKKIATGQDERKEKTCSTSQNRKINTTDSTDRSIRVASQPKELQETETLNPIILVIVLN